MRTTVTIDDEVLEQLKAVLQTRLRPSAPYRRCCSSRGQLARGRLQRSAIRAHYLRAGWTFHQPGHRLRFSSDRAGRSGALRAPRLAISVWRVLQPAQTGQRTHKRTFHGSNGTMDGVHAFAFRISMRPWLVFMPSRVECDAKVDHVHATTHRIECDRRSRSLRSCDAFDESNG